MDYDKQLGREEKKHVDDEEYYINNMSFSKIRPADPGEKKIIAHNFGLKEERFKEDLKREFDLEKEELILESG